MNWKIGLLWWSGIVLGAAGCNGGGDGTPPTTTADPPGGYYRREIAVTLEADEPALIYYTVLAGSGAAAEEPVQASGESPVGGIVISGDTVLQFYAVDRAGNQEEEKTEEYHIDTTPPEVLGAVAGGSGSMAPEAGDRVRFEFSEPMADPGLDESNIDSVLALDHGHSWRDGSGLIGGAALSEDGIFLTVTLSASVSSPTVAVGDRVAFDGETLVDRAGLPVTGTVVITGYFGEDLFPPSSSITAPSEWSFVGGEVEISGNATDNESGLAAVEVSTDGGETWDEAELSGEGSTREFSYSWNPTQEGEVQVCSRARDRAENVEAAPGCISVTVDISPPSVQVLFPESGDMTDELEVLISGSASDTGSGLALVEASTDGGIIFLPVSGLADWYFPWSPSDDGRYAVVARAVDGVGHVALSAPVQVIVDRHAPVSAITSPLDGGFVGGQVYIEVSAEDDGSGVASVEVQAGAGEAWATAALSGSHWLFLWDTGTIGDGQYTLRSRATDVFGHQEIPGPGVGVTVENDPPNSTILAPAGGELIGRGFYTISGTASDPGSGVASVQVSTNSGGSWNAAAGKESWSYAWNVSNLNSYWGPRAILARAIDNAGNYETTPAAVTVTVDTIPPLVNILSPPSPSFFHYPVGASVAVLARASDVGSGMDSIEVNPGDGTDWEGADYDISFPSPPNGPYDATYYWGPPLPGDDSYLVRARAWDAAGNVGNSGTVSVTFDRVPPDIIAADPAPGSSCVRTGTNVRVRFSEEVVAGSLDQAGSGIYREGATSVSPGDYGFYWQQTASPTDTLVLAPFLSQPERVLDDLATYQVRITGPVTDPAGNLLLTDSFLFTTRDSSPPQVAARWPDSNQMVYANYFRAVTVTFTEPMDRSRGRISVTSHRGTQVVANLGVNQPSVTGFLEWAGPVTMALSLTSPVLPGRGYTVSVQEVFDDSACGSDQTGNAVSGLEWPVVTRGASWDVTAPVVVSSFPGSGDVAPSVLPDFAWNSVLFVLSEPLDPATLVPGNISVLSGGSPAGYSIAYRLGADQPGMGLLIQPSFPLGSNIQVTLGAGIKDTAGNPLEGAPVALNFSTGSPDATAPALVASQPEAGSGGNSGSVRGGLGFSREIALAGIGRSNLTLEETATGIGVRGMDFEGVRPGIRSRRALRIHGGTKLPLLKDDTQYTLSIHGLQDLDGHLLSPDPLSFTFRTAASGGNRVPVLPDVFGTAGYSEVFTNGNTRLRFEAEAFDPEAGTLLVRVEDQAGGEWPLVSILSGRYRYATPVTSTPDSGDEDLGYDGFMTYTFYASDLVDEVAVERDLYVFPLSQIPIQDDPISDLNVPYGDVTLTWHNVNTALTDYLVVRVLSAVFTEVHSAKLPPDATEYTVPRELLVPGGLYLWEVTAVRTGYGGEPIGRGSGYNSLTSWFLLSLP